MRIVAVLVWFTVVWTGLGAQEDLTLLTRKPHSAAALLSDPADTNIVRITAEILRRQHYLKAEKRFDEKLSSDFLDRYLDTLDNLRLYFSESDMREFDVFRRRLAEMTLVQGDSTPSLVIFRRFRERLHQQHDYVSNLLATTALTFTNNDRFPISRKNLPRPKDLQEAQALWRERVRYEYLQEKLGIGRPEVIVKIVADRLDKNDLKSMTTALEEKVSKEKAAAIVKLVEDRAGKSSRQETLDAVSQKLEADNAQEIVKTITGRYNRVLRTIDDYDKDDVLQFYLTALCRVFDPHSDYMGKSELENFSIGMKLSLFGIGAVLRSEDGICKIQSLSPNGPAERSGKLKPNDKIIAVAQSTNSAVDVVDMKLNKVVELIRGPKDTEVRLTVIPANAADPSQRKLVPIVRDEIKLEDQEAKAKIYEVPTADNKSTRLGYIDLPSFYSSFELAGRKSSSPPKSTTTDVARLLRKLVHEHIGGLVLDLRRNGGGSLEEAINLTGLFIKEGPVVQVKDPDGTVLVDRDTDPNIFYDGPLLVLTSRFSASASEILAGALQDYGRALVVGDSSTHGKGTVQSLIQLAPILRSAGVYLDNPGAIKITIRKFYRASGLSTQLEGVTPDIVLPSINNHADVGEVQLENALKCDRIPAAEYEKVNRVEPYLAELRKRSEARVTTDPDYTFIRDEITRYKKALEEKSVSLNEAQRLKEKKEADERAKARRKELASRAEPSGKVYEFSLKQAEQPGLPPAMKKTNTVAVAEDGAHKTAPAHVLEDDEEDPIPDDKIVAVDPPLDEARRILQDYIKLVAASKGLASTAGAAK